MMGSRWVLAAVVIVGSLAVIACGGGSSESSGKTPPAGTTPAGDATSASGSTAQATSSGGGSGDPEVQAIGSKFASSTFNATYKVSGSDTAQFSDGKLVLEKDGDKNFRMEVTTKQDGVDTEIIFIETADVQAFCLTDAGTLGALLGIEAGKGVCFPTSATDGSNPVSSLRSSLNDFENANVTVLEKTSRSIAGQDTKCFKTKDNDTSEISTSCFADDGALLYVKTEGDNASEIEAQDISKNVNSDDFKLPYEQRDLPTGTGSDSTP